MFIGKLSNKILNSTDNVLISSLVSTMLVGVYSQYSMFLNGFLRIFSQVNTSIVGSVGNMLAVESEEKSESIYNVLTYLFFVLGCFGGIGIFAAANPFLKAFVGKEYLLGELTLGIVCLNMFFETLKMPLWTFFTASGLFKYDQWISLAGCILNLVTSIILGKIYGMIGIFLGTFISLLFMVILKVFFLTSRKFKHAFRKGQLIMILYIALFLFGIKIMNIVHESLPITNSFLAFVIYGFISLIISVLVSIVPFLQTYELDYWRDFIIRKFKKA